MGEITSPLINLELGPPNGRLILKTQADLAAFLQSETTAWAWINEAYQSDGHLDGLRTATTNQLLQAQHDYTNLAAHTPESSGWQNYLSQINGRIRNAYGNNHLPLPNTPRAKFIQNLKDTNRIRAAYATAFFTNTLPSQLRSPALQGVVDAILFEYGIKHRSQAEKAALEALHDEWKTRLSEHSTTQTELEARFADVLTSIADRDDKHQADITKQLDEHQTKFTETIDSAESRMNGVIEKAELRLAALEQTYEKKLQLSAPVLYWQRKQSSHWIASGVLSVITLIAGLTALTVLSIQIENILGDWLVPTSIPFSKIGMFLIISALSVWGIRLLVRLLLSNIHLAQDASERVTMVQTYLALTRKGKYLKDDDLRLILAALFRPAADGVVKDDALPHFGLDMLTKPPKP